MKKNVIILGLLFSYLFTNGQDLGEIHGDFNLNMQSYLEDASINAVAADEVIRNNSYLNILFTF